MSKELKTQKSSVANFLNFPNTKKFLEDTLSDKRAEFVSNLIALTDSDSNLANCEPSALMKCALNATALNLPLNKNLGYAYVIAYGGNPSFQIGYKGLVQLAIRSGAYKHINACEIREGEIKRNKITGEITFIGDNEGAEIVGYLAYLELTSGFTASVYMSEKDIEQHAVRFSKMYQSDKKYNSCKSKWSDPLARPKMASKTVLKMLLGTYGVLSTELVTALSNDSDKEDSSSSNRTIDAEIIEQPDVSSQDEENVQI